MMKSLVSLSPLLILLAPLLGGLIIGVFGGILGSKLAWIGVLAEALALAVSVYVLYGVIAAGPQRVDVSGLLFAPHDFFHFDFYIDRLTAVMMVHIAAISTLIHLFSIRYMQQERGYGRFHSLLSFTTFVLFGMVSSANLLTLFIFWQLLSWLVPLLSHNYEHVPTARGAFRTFIIQRGGDFAFLAGIVLAYRAYGTLDLQQLFDRAAAVPIIVMLWPTGLEIHTSTAVTLLIFIGAMSKSAQFPLHMWLPDSLYAPTPVHALLHAGIINAGGFLLARLAPLFALSPATLHWVFAVGLLTALLGSSMMLVQNDIKKTLGYSTIGQMGFMIMECGLGAYGLAIFHLIAHGLFKGSIFLNCGYVIHAARQEPRRPPTDQAVDSVEFSTLAWLTGLTTTLILPLIIVLAAHGALNIHLRDSQGTVIFLFFGWATSSQAILTLYRLRAVASWKVAVTMLAALFVVVVTYLLAAESFTYFLYPAPGEVANHFHAAALPIMLFDLLVTSFAFVIVFGWILIYPVSHGRTLPMPQWVDAFQVRVYLLLINRLYLDTVSMTLQPPCTRVIERLGRSRMMPYVASLLAGGMALLVAGQSPKLSQVQLIQLAVVALLLPLFPLHGVYITALTRSRGYLAPGLALLLPMAGSYGLADLLPELPTSILRAVNLLALVGALYASLKALAQVQGEGLLAYASLALYSALWWLFSFTGRFVAPASAQVVAVALLSAGLLLAWLLLQRWYGNLALDRMHGLARPMPRFATIFSLFVMAAVFMPPIALFSVPAELLRQRSLTFSLGLFVILLTWFLASWYLFRMMQRLLFGRHRSDIRYVDLRPREVGYFVVPLAIVLWLSFTPPRWLEYKLSVQSFRTAREVIPWQR